MSLDKAPVTVTGDSPNKWAQQFEKAANSLTQVAERLQPVSVVHPIRELDREQLTTPEEAKKYDRMMEKDFLKLDAKGKITDTENLYRVVHIYPQFQTANPSEFIAYLVIEQFRFIMTGEDQPRRQIVTSFNLKARDFIAQFRLTVTEAVALNNG